VALKKAHTIKIEWAAGSEPLQKQGRERVRLNHRFAKAGGTGRSKNPDAYRLPQNLTNHKNCVPALF